MPKVGSTNRLFSTMGCLHWPCSVRSRFGYIGLQRGESISGYWIVIAAVCVYLIATVSTVLYIADKVRAGPDADGRLPYRHNDGLDYCADQQERLVRPSFCGDAGAGRWWGRCWPNKTFLLVGT